MLSGSTLQLLAFAILAQSVLSLPLRQFSNFAQVSSMHDNSEDVFDLFDSNRDSQLNEDEFVEYFQHFLKMSQIGQNEDQAMFPVLKFMMEMDDDENALISQEEFERALDQIHTLGPAFLVMAFEFMDEDENGLVDIQEFVDLVAKFSHLGYQQRNELEGEYNIQLGFQVMDDNHDGFVSFEELQRLVSNFQPTTEEPSTSTTASDETTEAETPEPMPEDPESETPEPEEQETPETTPELEAPETPEPVPESPETVPESSESDPESSESATPKPEPETTPEATPEPTPETTPAPETTPESPSTPEGDTTDEAV